MQNYDWLLNTKSSKQWQSIGVRRRAGAALALFSVRSKESIGVGEFRDLRLLADWCESTGLSIIQLLPLNDVGFSFRPYDAESTFALEPMHLSLKRIEGADAKEFQEDFDRLETTFAQEPRVNYAVKPAKLDLLWKIFKVARPGQRLFEKYQRINAYWLRDYALYRVLKEIHQGRKWEEWPDEFRHRDPKSLSELAWNQAERIQFYEWLQWQADAQFRDAKKYAAKKNVFLMGDLPFLVSRDSADVWAHQEYFKLDLIAGAPPDAFFSSGQRWGMPPYDWGRISADGHRYLAEKLSVAGRFYDLFRIDHVVGTFRLWSIHASEPAEHAGLHGFFDPADENQWEEHGKRILSVMTGNSMLACAEDLGVVPACSNRTLAEFGIPGIEIQRWARDWGNSYEFQPPHGYRQNSIAMISTHDTTSLAGWWLYEAGTVDEGLFRRKCSERGVSYDAVSSSLFDFSKSFHGRLRWRPELGSVDGFLAKIGMVREHAGDFAEIFLSSFGEKERFMRFLGQDGPPPEEVTPVFIRAAVEKAQEAASIFSIQLLQDWLSLDPSFKLDPWEDRINFPGTMNDRNWTLTVPFLLEKIKKLKINSTIRDINLKTERA